MSKYSDKKIEGWMSEEELQWLFEQAQNMESIVEIGSFKGRSTDALLSSGAKVTAIDNWKLHWDKSNAQHGETVYKEFMENTKEYKNIEILRSNSNEAVTKFDEESVDMVFMDFTTTYPEYLESIKKWLPKTNKLICGHEYSEKFPDVIKAVDEVFEKPDGVIGMIWYKYIS